MKYLIITLLIVFSNICVSYSQTAQSNNIKKILQTLEDNDLGAKAYLADKYQDDKEIMTYLLKIDGMLLKYTSSRLRKDRNLVLIAVRQNGLALDYANKLFQYDKEIILEASIENIEALEFVPRSITKDREFLLQILQNSKQINKSNDQLN
jgi:hypothetical protein